MNTPQDIANRILIAKHSPDHKAKQQARLLLVEDAADLMGQLALVTHEFAELQKATRDMASLLGVLVESAPEQKLTLSQLDLAKVDMSRELTWNADDDGTVVVAYAEEQDDLAGAEDGSPDDGGEPQAPGEPADVGGAGEAPEVSGLPPEASPVPDLRGD